MIDLQRENTHKKGRKEKTIEYSVTSNGCVNWCEAKCTCGLIKALEWFNWSMGGN